jgi:hypothetical protein
MGSSAGRGGPSGYSGGRGAMGPSSGRSYSGGTSGRDLSGPGSRGIPGGTGTRISGSGASAGLHRGPGDHSFGGNHDSLGAKALGPNLARDASIHGHHDWDHHFDNHNWHHDWANFHHCYHHYPSPFWYSSFWFSPFWYPWWDYDYGFRYASPYLYCYEAAPADLAWYATAPAPVAPTVMVAEKPEAAADDAAADNTGLSALEFYNAARAEFKKGSYRGALRLASHAAIESPQNAKVHELNSLALLGLNDYRGAAIEAHAAMAFGPLSDWSTIYGYYDDEPAYTKQLRTLEKYAKEHPASPESHFLLAYHYLLIGSKDAAKTRMAEAVKLAPKDSLAAYVLKQLEAGRPVTPPPPPAGLK